jgi:transketolase
VPSLRHLYGRLTDGTSGNRAKAWLVTGPLGRGAAFAIDFAVAVRHMLRASERD